MAAAGALHHIISRVIEREKIFWDDADCDSFVNRLGKVLIETHYNKSIRSLSRPSFSAERQLHEQDIKDRAPGRTSPCDEPGRTGI